MAELNNDVTDKIEKPVNSVEVKGMGVGGSKESNLNNSHEAANTPNGNEEKTPEETDGQSKTENGGTSAAAATTEVESNEAKAAALDTAADAVDDEIQVKPTTPSTAQPTSEEPAAPATKEKSPPPSTETVDEAKAEETEEKEEMPSPKRGRGRPQTSKRGRPIASTTRGSGASAATNTRGAKKQKQESDVTEPEKRAGEEESKEEELPELKPEGEVEKKSESAPTADVKPKGQRGRKRQTPASAATVEETTTTSAAKHVKSNDDGPSGGQAGAEKTPLFNGPLIVEGKRTRSKTDRLESTFLVTPDHTKHVFEIPQGSGTKLGEIPYIEAMISKSPTIDLKPLHRLCFGHLGKNHEIRKNLRTFNGFESEKGTEFYNRKLKAIENWSMKQLRLIADVLGVKHTQKKEDLEKAVLDFLLKPSDTGRQPPQGKRRKSSSGSKKRGGRAKKASGGETSGKSEGESEGGDGTEESEEKTEENEQEGDEPSEENEPEPPKGKRGRPSKKGESSAPAPTAASASRKASSKGEKKPPTDAALITMIKELLRNTNLEQSTMREMYQKVLEKYPDHDLTSRKAFIKETVKSLIKEGNE